MKVLITFLKLIFPRRPKLTGRQINMWEHTEWGNSIYFLSYRERKVSGHLYNRPSVGDILNAKMASGKIGQFIVTKVDYVIDPNDMFFCEVSDFGYRENI
jgi:hypothetical protein